MFLVLALFFGLLAIGLPVILMLGFFGYWWYDRYDFEGDLDEVRIARVVRSPEWVRLEYENQRPLQTLVGPLVPPGDASALARALLEALSDPAEASRRVACVGPGA